MVGYQEALNELKSGYTEKGGQIHAFVSNEAYEAIVDALETIVLLGISRDGNDECASCKI